MREDFYKAFEDRYRGSFSLIKKRLAFYLPFILPLKKMDSSPKALDLGCGRGEWLEILKENGFAAKGVDINPKMFEQYESQGLDFICEDMLVYLKAQKRNSLHLISAFHLIEHISFEDLQVLLAEAHRVLVPGGLLILETPNPENLRVGTSLFYMDPTHRNPLPDTLVSFAAEYAQFDRVKTLFLQGGEISEPTCLRNVFEGVGYDYAVISQKKAEEGIKALFDQPFETECAKSLNDLIAEYDQKVEMLQSQVDGLILFHQKVAQSVFFRFSRLLYRMKAKLLSPLLRRSRQA